MKENSDGHKQYVISFNRKFKQIQKWQKITTFRLQKTIYFI